MSASAAGLAGPRAARFWSTSNGKKAVMAVSGIVLAGFVFAHLAGNLQIFIGPEKFNDRDLIAPPQGNNTWLNGRNASVVVRQLVWDGFTTINEIWRQTARVDAAAHRTRERTELLALDASESYIDVVRYTRLIALSQENVVAHRRLFANVNSRYQGGRAGEGDLQQANERVAAAEAVLAEFRRSLDEARARFRKVIGIEPYNLRAPGRLPGMPRAKDDALAVTLRHNPTIQAAQSDSDAAKHAFHATAGAFVPTVALEGRASRGTDSDQIVGRSENISGKVVISWDVFRGGQDLWRRNEMGERFTEQSMRYARLQRDAFESIDKAWAARTLTGDRIAALLRQIEADRKVIVSPRLVDLHPIAVATLQRLRKAKPNDHGVVATFGPDLFSVAGSPSQVDRSIRILNAVARASAERGFSVERGKNSACLLVT